jgi:succinate-acetate transporter protein
MGFLVAQSVWCISTLSNSVDATGALGLISMVFGGFAMSVSGLLALLHSDVFSGTVFVIYGLHWLLGGVMAYTGAGEGAGDDAASLAYYYLSMIMVTAVFFVGSLRTNVPFATTLGFLVPLFALLAASWYVVAWGCCTGAMLRC